jgi:hypothetical protein
MPAPRRIAANILKLVVHPDDLYLLVRKFYEL